MRKPARTSTLSALVSSDHEEGSGEEEAGMFKSMVENKWSRTPGSGKMGLCYEINSTDSVTVGQQHLLKSLNAGELRKQIPLLQQRTLQARNVLPMRNRKPPKTETTQMSSQHQSSPRRRLSENRERSRLRQSLKKRERAKTGLVMKRQRLLLRNADANRPLLP